MVHTFEMKNRYIAFDSESCALHELDEMAFLLLRLYILWDGKTPSREALLDFSEKNHFLADEVFSCAKEFDELRDLGELFSKEQSVAFTSLYPEEPLIKAMCLHICHDCNLRCKYCFAGTGDFGTGNRSMLSLETGKKAVDFLIAASGKRRNLDIDFFGGEPLMNWDVVKELTYYCEDRAKEAGKDIRLTITTNCLLLDEEKTEFINTHMKNCVLSIDGRPEVNDRMRPAMGGQGSYPAVSKRIKSFLEKRTSAVSNYYEHYVRGTYTRENLDFSKDVIHMAEELGARHISVEPVVAEDGAGYEIRVEDIPEIEKEYEALAEYLLERNKGSDPIQFFHFIMDSLEGPCLFKRLKGCGVGAEYCAVAPNGDIFPCHQFAGDEDMKMGNVNDISSILDENKKLLPGKKATDILFPEVRSTFIDRLMPNKPECKNCFSRYHCGGGCPANAYHATGDLDGLYEIGCRLAKKRLECSLWMQVVSGS